MVSVPLRGVVVGFTDTEKATVPLPVPPLPEVMVMNALLLMAVHVQLGFDAITPTVPVPPLAPTFVLVELSVKLQAAPTLTTPFVSMRGRPTPSVLRTSARVKAWVELVP